MRRSLHDLWDGGRGPVRRLAPPTRLVCGGLVLVAVLGWPVVDAHSAALLGLVVAIWVVSCGPPWRAARLALLLGLLPLLPYLLLAPMLAPKLGWAQAVALPLAVVYRGVAATMACLAAATTLGASDLREALVRLPVPGIVSAILLQIVQQTATLLSETRQVGAAMALRGAAGGGRTAWRILASLPQVWLPRVLVRAERVAAAMELRGFAESLPTFGSARRGGWDVLALALSTLLVAAAASLRLRGLP